MLQICSMCSRFMTRILLLITRPRRYSLPCVNGYIVLPKDASTSTIFVVGNQVPASDYGTGTTTIPQFMERMLLAYAISDYYRSDGQNEKALAEEQRAEEYYQQELERFERLESQNRIKINNYPNYYSNLLVQQTVI